jgi:hypothetical protein
MNIMDVQLIDEILSTAGLEILNAVYKQRGVSRDARDELARRISEIMERARERAARELREVEA